MKNLTITTLVFLLLTLGCFRSTQESSTEEFSESIPVFNVDPFWPKALPDNWLLGEVAGIDVDSKDHVWIIHRPKTLGLNEGNPNWSIQEFSFVPAPPVIEFDSEGNMIQAWGGSGDGFDWPEGEHGIFIDNENNVWIAGMIKNDHQILKFTSDGKFLLQIGRSGKTGGSNDENLLGKPADITIDSITNEVYVADGYLNRRIIIFDAKSGKYKRHWGAYGNKPDDTKQEPYDPDNTPPKQFGVVHAVRISNDGLVYVCDRSNNRIQVFQRDGKFLFEEFVAYKTSGAGSTWDLAFSHDPNQAFIYVADGTNQCVWILERQNLKTLGHFGRIGRYAGQFIWVHSLATDSKGNIYTAEVHTGRRAQKFIGMK